MPAKCKNGNRRRKWAPKARTGCRTCKNRHVKCDEEKPVCRRCILSGFRCDGYPAIVHHEDAEEESPESSSANDPDSKYDDDATTLVDGGSQGSLSVTKSSSPASSITANVEEGRRDFRPILTIAPNGPYVGNEMQAMQFFVDRTSVMVGRSPQAPLFWNRLVPQAAWHYPSVRHAMLAAATANSSLLCRDDANGLYKKSQIQILTHTSKAMRSLRVDKPPLDIFLLTSATLGILDLFLGQWDTACVHVTSGAKLAKQGQLNGTSADPYISMYCQAFAGALPGVLKPVDDISGDKNQPEENAIVRLREAVASLCMALDSFQKALPKLETYPDIENRKKIAHVIGNSENECRWLLPRWEALLQAEIQNTSNKQDTSHINYHRVESPFSAVMTELNEHLDHGADLAIPMFQIKMERTLPFYLFAKSGPNVTMRKDTAQLMLRGASLRGRHIESPSSDRTSPQYSFSSPAVVRNDTKPQILDGS